MTKTAPANYRTLVQQSIGTLLGHQARWVGTALWDQHYAAQTTPSFKAFSQQLCEQLQRPELANPLYSAILVQLLQQRSQPAQTTSAPVTSPQSSAPAALTPAARMFIALVKELFAQLGYRPQMLDNRSIYPQPQLRSLLRDLHQDHATRLLWSRILLKGEIEPLREITEPQLTSEFHALYRVIAENFGSSVSDEALANATSAIESRPVARDYSPRRFL